MLYFEYRNKRGHVIGWSDNFNASIEEASRRAYTVMARIAEIYTVIAHDADNDNALNKWGK